jgi:hypothetical protein
MRAALLAALAVAGVAAAAGQANLVTDGGAELVKGAADSSTIVTPAGWKTTGQLDAVQYGASGGFPDPKASTAIQGGKNFFGGGNVALSTGIQIVSVAHEAARIDAGRVSVELAADLGGYLGQADYASVTAVFRSALGNKLGALVIGPVTSDQRKGQTVLLPRSKVANVPARTRSIQIVLVSKRFAGTYDDGYADNVSLRLLGRKVPGQ